MASRAQPVKQAQNVRRSLAESSWYHPRIVPPCSAVVLATWSDTEFLPDDFMSSERDRADACRRDPTPLSGFMRVKRGVPRWLAVRSLSPLERLAPFQAPVVADQIDDFAVLIVELVGNLEDGNHQPTLGRPSRVTA